MIKVVSIGSKETVEPVTRNTDKKQTLAKASRDQADHHLNVDHFEELREELWQITWKAINDISRFDSVSQEVHYQP